MKTERTLILRYFFPANLGHLFKRNKFFFFINTLSKGPCLESRGNFSGPESNFQIKTSQKNKSAFLLTDD